MLQKCFSNKLGLVLDSSHFVIEVFFTIPKTIMINNMRQQR